MKEDQVSDGLFLKGKPRAIALGEESCAGHNSGKLRFCIAPLQALQACAKYAEIKQRGTEEQSSPWRWKAGGTMELSQYFLSFHI